MNIKDPLADFKTSAPSIVGFSTINHNIRVKLGLNCSEYVIIDYIHSRNTAGKVTDIDNCFIKTGFKKEEQSRLLESLMKKGFIIPPMDGDQAFKITSKWTSALSSIDKEFEKEFWVMFNPDTMKQEVCWPGSKSTAKKNYAGVRKGYTFDFLMSQRNHYFAYLETCHKYGFARQKMMASVFLGPQERFLEDWKKQRDDLIKTNEPDKVKKEPGKAITMEEMKKLYEKNTNK